jgi:hypothetical protein
MDAAVWPAIAALALFAMKHGHCFKWAHSKGREEEDGAAQSLITDFFLRLTSSALMVVAVL